MIILKIILVICYSVLSFIFAKEMYQNSRKLNIKINIHTLPIILLCLLYLVASFWLLIIQTPIFLRVGLILSAVGFIISSIKIPDIPNTKLINQIMIIMGAFFFWPICGMFMGFHLYFFQELTQAHGLKNKK